MSRALRLLLPVPSALGCAVLVAGFLPLGAAAQSLSAGSPAVEGALAHARDAAAARGALTVEFAVTDAYADARTGHSYVYLRQSVAGLDVVGTEASVAVSGTGRVVHAAGLERAAPAPAGLAASPALGASQAAASLAGHNGLGGGSFGVLDQKGGADRAVTLTDGGVALEPVPARLVWHRDDAGALRLAWEVGLYTRDAAHYWLGYVDAATGVVLAQADLVVHDTFGEAAPAAPASLAPWAEAVPAGPAALVGSYTVFRMPIEAPYYGSRSAVANPDNAAASPYGWHDTNGAAGAEYTRTRGNNVHAYTDTDANNSPDAGSDPDGGAALTFNFPLDLTQAPSTYRPAAVTNLFYWNNVIHDVLYQYGFTEAGGNFQVNNYGRGGAGNDDVRAEAQDGSGTNNANFFTPADGSRPRMQMYVGTSPTPDVDGDFDNGVIVHEYGHGVSNRLTGGPSQAGCLGNAEQQGEGWSDWYALMLTMDANDTATQRRGIGNYLFGYGANGGGIRLAPYSTDFAVNNYTYQRTRTMTAVHQIGFVWATILWEVTWDMIAAHGFSDQIYDGNGTAGNQLMLRLVTEGLRLQPCSPGFVSSRDAILAADQNLFGGAHLATLRAAFARRGLGYSATQGSTNSNSDNTEAFNLWPTATNQPPTAAFTFACTGLTCQFTDGSSDADGTVASRAWTFGDGGTSTATNPSRTYAAAGTYTVGLTVTDDDGATGATTRSVTVTSGGSAITLSASGRRTNNRYYADLTWGPADGGSVRVYQNNVSVGTTADDGAVTVNIGRRATGTYTYRVCETDSGDCSNNASVTFLDGVAGAGPTDEAATLVDGEVLAGVRISPNPVTATATLRFGVPEAADVELVVYNALGQRVAVLARGAHAPGTHAATLDTAGLPAGVYVYHLRAGTEVHTGRFLVVR